LVTVIDTSDLKSVFKKKKKNLLTDWFDY